MLQAAGRAYWMRRDLMATRTFSRRLPTAGSTAPRHSLLLLFAKGTPPRAAASATIGGCSATEQPTAAKQAATQEPASTPLLRCLRRVTRFGGARGRIGHRQHGHAHT